MKAKNRTIFHEDVERVLSRLDDSTFTLIYVDPPWDISSEREKTVKKINDDYEQFLTRVLQSCRRLLTDKGAIYIHTPPVSSVNCRLILDQVFEKAASLEIIWQIRHLRTSHQGSSHEALLRYNKTDQSTYNPITTPPNISRYNLSDARGPYLLLDLTTPGLRAILHYHWRGFEPPAGRSWRFNLERMEQYLAEGRIVIPASGRPRLKQYFDESIGTDIGSVWDDIDLRGITPTQPAMLFTQKPVELVSRIIRQASNEGDWVLDPFFGTGSLLVEAEKLNRKWVGCDSSTVAVNVSCKRLMEQSSLAESDLTVLGSNDLKNFQPVAASESSIFVSIAELTEAKNRLQQISKIVSEIRSRMVAKDSSDEDILDAMLDKCSSVGLVISPAAREDCQLHLSAEIDLFEKLSPASKDFLVTALFTLETHQDGFDFSFVSLGAWKAIELELAIQIFSPFKQWFVARHPNVTEVVALDLQNSKSAKLASFLKGKKDMALGEMQWNLNLLATSEKTIKNSLSLQDFQMFAISHFKTPGFILKPTGITESISQENIDRYRNGAAHTTLFSRTKAEESLKFVKSILPRLILGLLPKEP